MKTIISKRNKTIINLERVNNIYVGADGCTIKAMFADGSGCMIDIYKTKEETAKAMEMIAQRVAKQDIIYMPSEDQLSNFTTFKEAPQRFHGRKQKGHGGS